MSKFCYFVFCFFIFQSLFFCQDISRAKKNIDFLCSKKCYGRGYVREGMGHAAKFLVRELCAAKLKPLNGNSYYQELEMGINTFPGAMSLSIDGKKLIPGKDFLVENSSRGSRGKFLLQKTDSNTYRAVDDKGNPHQLYLTRKKKLTWSASQEQSGRTIFELTENIFPTAAKEVRVNVNAEYVSNFKASNICAKVIGTTCADTFIVFSAHYDHLGGMGKKVYFPGANDNASGVSMLLELARHYGQSPGRYSVVFLLFCGEEAGLVGSKFFVENPLIPLSQIKFLVNLDLLGTGDEGITVVNATEYKSAFDELVEINNRKNLLAQIKPRGKAANSDHYWFSERGVPSFFLYTMGGIKAYHDIYDVPRTLPLNRFSEVFQILTEFIRWLGH